MRLGQSLFVVVLFCTLCSCDDSEKRKLKVELDQSKEKISDLNSELKESKQKLQLALSSPDKAAFEELPPFSNSVSYDADDLETMKWKYSKFLQDYPSSSLVVEAKDRNDSIERLLNGRKAAVSRDAQVQEIERADLKDVDQFPQKYLGKTFRVKGSVRFAGVGPAWFNYRFLTADGAFVLLAMDYDLDRQIGMVGSTSGQFVIEVAREEKTQKIQYVLKSFSRN